MTMDESSDGGGSLAFAAAAGLESPHYMETETLKWGVSWLATISTIGLFLSGISLCLKVRKQGDTKDVTMVPFLITSANCAFWLK